jgi:hypothetical protein|tara:strand:+ start:6671 stop:6910 length:240 start_codon:yes stop_codon:yes gene_type:complete
MLSSGKNKINESFFMYEVGIDTKRPVTFGLRPQIIFELKDISDRLGVPQTRILEDALIKHLKVLKNATDLVEDAADAPE